MTPQEIKSRAAQLTDLPMDLVNIQQVAWIANISRITIWRQPPEKRPRTMVIGNAEMMQVDAAVEWATKYWAAKETA